MGTSTVSGPFRSQNGFQELVNGVWTPIGGGGGGGGGVVDVIRLVDSSPFPAFVGAVCNSYSEDPLQDPPTGTSAGNIIQLPYMDIGQAVLITNLTQDDNARCWALKLPIVPGYDWGYMTNNYGIIGFIDSGNIQLIFNVNSAEPGGPSLVPIFYFYSEGGPSFYIVRDKDWVVDGFGPIAIYNIVGNIGRIPSSELVLTPNFDQYPMTFSN